MWFVDLDFLVRGERYDESHLPRFQVYLTFNLFTVPDTPSIIKMSVCFAFLQTHCIFSYAREVVSPLYT